MESPHPNRAINTIIECINTISLAAITYFSALEHLDMDEWHTKLILQCFQTLHSIFLPHEPTLPFMESVDGTSALQSVALDPIFTTDAEASTNLDETQVTALNTEFEISHMGGWMDADGPAALNGYEYNMAPSQF